jgi:hypothetical protein
MSYFGMKNKTATFNSNSKLLLSQLGKRIVIVTSHVRCSSGSISGLLAIK